MKVRFRMKRTIYAALTLLLLSTSIYAKEGGSDQNIGEVIASKANFSIFAKAINQAGLQDFIENAKELTIFAPDDAAFAKLSEAAMNQLFSNKDLLRYIVEFHISEGIILAEDLQYRTYNPMMNARTVSVMIEGDDILIDESKIIKSDITASNGAIHVIDKVLGSM
jgi:uncharacterized surface protein with fasciclin (FAS1) repeats